MYFPYLRAKQEEVFAVLEADFLTDVTVPIFEPVTSTSKDTKTISKTTIDRWKRALDRGRRFAIVTNSAKGFPPPTSEDACARIEDDLGPAERVFPAIEIRKDTGLDKINEFARRFWYRTCLVIHRDHMHDVRDLRRALRPLSEPNTTAPVQVLMSGGVPEAVFRNLPARGRAFLRDGFVRQERNADYPPRTSFDNLFHTFGELGFDGFGDFTIVGDFFPRSPGGGPALQAALHLTEIENDRETVVANHFVSRTPPTRMLPDRKYFDALQQLVDHTKGRLGFDTVGVHAFYDSHSKSHYPNLGPPKRWSILHHFEIIERALAKKGAEPFF